MATQVRDLMAFYNLLEKWVAYVKDGGNLSTLAWTRTFAVSCTPLALSIPWQGSCFGHAFNKACQYACNDTNVCVGFHEANLKGTQFTLQKIITWIKKFGKGNSDWQKACVNVGLSHWKLKTFVKTRFTSKVILFRETLEYWDAINLCYGKQEMQKL